MAVGAVNRMETEANGMVELTIKSRTTRYRKSLCCIAVSKIVDFTLSAVFPREQINIPANLPLADSASSALDNFKQKDFSAVESDSTRKTLGVVWQSHSDKLTFSVRSIDRVNKITKRVILTEIARIFYPLGLLGPLVLALKLLMQDCWKLKIGWDESVPQAIHTAWQSFVVQSHLLEGLATSRHVTARDPKRIEIHGFCDASKRGYGACLYVRFVSTNGHVLVRLMCAKSRVAPVSKVSIPRLELCGAVLLTRLYSEAQSAFAFDIDRVVFWTDSEIVLCWLDKFPAELQTFEGNRVAEIQRMSPSIQWRHMRSADNLADPLLRGQTPAELARNTAWFDGLPWLYQLEDQSPETRRGHASELPGLRKQTCLVINSNDPFYVKFSSYSKLIRIIAYYLRFLLRAKHTTQTLSRVERDEAERRLWKIIQAEQYADEIKRLGKGATLKSSKIAAVDPYVDQCGIVRVGGRLRNAHLPEFQKHPVLLPSRRHVTELIIKETHNRLFHAGVRTTLYTLRHRFWLIDGTTQVKRTIHQCVECLR